MEYDGDPDWSDDRCLSCCKPTEGFHYGCDQDECIFENVANWSYAVCADCYATSSVGEAEETEEKEVEVKETYSAEELYVAKKVRISILQISYEFDTVFDILAMLTHLWSNYESLSHRNRNRCIFERLSSQRYDRYDKGH